MVRRSGGGPLERRPGSPRQEIVPGFAGALRVCRPRGEAHRAGRRLRDGRQFRGPAPLVIPRYPSCAIGPRSNATSGLRLKPLFESFPVAIRTGSFWRQTPPLLKCCWRGVFHTNYFENFSISLTPFLRHNRAWPTACALPPAPAPSLLRETSASPENRRRSRRSSGRGRARRS